MTLPEIERHRIDKFIFELMVQKAPAFVMDGILLSSSTRGNKVNIIVSRPLIDDPSRRSEHNVALFEFNPESKKWSLYFYDRKLKRHLYPNGDDRSLDKLIAEIIKDPTGIFWG